MTMAIRERRVSIDGGQVQLAGRFYEPVGTPRAHLVLHGATGVTQRFYAHFARWAATRGVGVLTYDYRDFGESRVVHPRDSRATFGDWAVSDQQAAVTELAALAPDGPLWMIGHSLGGLGFPFYRLDARFERIVTVGAGLGHFVDHPGVYRAKAFAFWYLLGPVTTALAGYLPAHRLLIGTDLPAGVYWQWRRWCTNRDFYAGDIGRTLPEPDYCIEGPDIHIIALADDVVVPPSAVARYRRLFPAGRVRSTTLDPASLDLGALNHIEVFARSRENAWPAILEGVGREGAYG